MENFLSPWTIPSLREGRYKTPMPPKRKLQMISINDIGKFVSHIIEYRENFINKSIDIASDEISGKEATKILSDYSGHTMEYFELPPSEYKNMSEDMLKMYEWFNEVGYNIDINKLHKLYPYIKWLTFEDWVKEQDWSILDQHIPQII